MAKADPKKLYDGTVRGLIFAALSGVLQVVVNKTDFLSSDDFADLLPAVLLASFVLGGVYDAYIRPRLKEE